MFAIQPIFNDNLGMAELPIVAILNTSPDTVELLSLFFEHHDMLAVSAFTYDIRQGKVDLARLLQTHRVDVVVYDIAPPYERNWLLFVHLRDTILQQHPCVLTTTNAKLVNSLIGADVVLYEILEAVRA